MIGSKSLACRTALAVVAFTALGAFVGCGGGIDTFTIEESATAVVEKGSVLEGLVGGLGFGDDFTKFDITSNQTLKNQGVKRSQIDSVRLRKLTLTITDPATGQTLDFLDRIEFFVDAEGVDSKRLAYRDPIADELRSFDCTLENLELAPYVAASSMSITTAAKGKRPQQTTTIEAKMQLEVDVNVSGLLD